MGFEEAIMECEGDNSSEKNSANNMELVSRLCRELFHARKKGFMLMPFLLENGFNKVAIYGMGQIGRIIYDEIQELISFTIDKKDITYKGIHTRKPCDVTNDIDLIVITPVNKTDLIKQYLSQKTSARLLTLEEILKPQLEKSMRVLGNINNNQVLGHELFGATIRFWGRNSSVSVGEHCYAEGLIIDIYSDVDLLIGDGLIVQPGSWEFWDGARCTLEKNITWRIENHVIHAFNNSNIYIGEGCCFQNDIFIIYDNSHLDIGKDCLFGRNVTLRLGDGHKIINNCTGERTNNYHEPIIIDDHVWIGQDVLVLYNTHIGKNCIVGARSVVKGKFPDNCMIGGYMARILKSDVTWSR